MAGQKKIKRFVIAGASLICLGLLFHFAGVNPIVKRIWTPAWVLFSGGCCFLLLALFYAVVDVYKVRKWSFPLKVIGMNSIAAYVLAHTITGFIASSFSTHLGQHYDQLFGDAYSSLVSGLLVY